MDDYVPDYGWEEEDHVASAFGKFLADPANDGLAEIVWQKGPALRWFSQPDRSDGPPVGDRADANATANVAEENGEGVFMGEDEMASWLHYSPEIACAERPSTTTTTTLSPPELQPSTTLLPPSDRGMPSRDSTVVDSNVMFEGIAPPQPQPPPPPLPVSSTVCQREMSTSAAVVDHRKRKAREADDDFDVEDGDGDSDWDFKKKGDGRPVRRSRAAEVHNLSERRRRDRINEKMKALQQLVPLCNKVDKASMLEDAVEYIKSLQRQIQMISMGYSTNPMMYTGMPQYAPPMGISMGIPMGSGHIGARVQLPALGLREQPNSQSNPQSGFMCFPSPNQIQMPNLPNPYQQYFGFQHMHFPPQDQRKDVDKN